MDACAIRALWVLSSSNEVRFSRRFVAVEHRWRLLQSARNSPPPADVSPSAAWSTPQNDRSSNNQGNVLIERGPASKPSNRVLRERDDSTQSTSDKGVGEGWGIPLDAEVARCFRSHQEEMESSQGLRKLGTKPGTDAWLDDPVTQHVLSLRTSRGVLWPVVKQVQGGLTVLVLPLVDPLFAENYQALRRGQNGAGVNKPEVSDLSTLILLTPAITMAFSVASAIGNVLSPPPALPPMSAPSTASLYSFGLVDSLTGFTKSPSQKGMVAQTAKVEAVGGTSGKLRKEDLEALRTFIAEAMPSGQPLDLNPSLASAIASNGFSAADVPPPDVKQPYWKPYLYRGKQRLFLMVRERVSAALFDREGVKDIVSVSGELLCRADLEGLPDVTIPLTFPREAGVRALSVHPSAQSPEATQGGAILYLSPPLGLFTLARYQAPAPCEKAPVLGFFQLQMLSESEAAVLIRLTLMEGLRKESSLEHCTLTIPFPGRTIASFEGTPTVGTLSTGQDSSLVWRVVTPGRWFGGKTGEATLSATVLLGDGSKEPGKKEPEAGPMSYPLDDKGDDIASAGRPATWADPFAWDRYSHARVSFKLSGCSLTETAINTAGVVIYPPAKATVEATYEVIEGDYILWNSLGKSPPVHRIPGLDDP